MLWRWLKPSDFCLTDADWPGKCSASMHTTGLVSQMWTWGSGCSPHVCSEHTDECVCVCVWSVGFGAGVWNNGLQWHIRPLKETLLQGFIRPVCIFHQCNHIKPLLWKHNDAFNAKMKKWIDQFNCELQILITDLVFVHHKLHFELICIYLQCDFAHSLGKNPPFVSSYAKQSVAALQVFGKMLQCFVLAWSVWGEKISRGRLVP